jgi:alpha-glucosidase
VLSRAGFAGIQRYAANWMGDNQARWDHLWLSMPMAMGLGLSGQPFIGADIGGFQGDSNAELFLRWMQYGTLTPFCRNHSEIGYVDQYVWSWGEPIQDLARAAIELRYRLLPYIYAAFLRAAETGAPVQRPLLYDYQYDATVRDIDDEYLLGPDLLVAPVISAGVTARHVYLPAGGWYEWHTDQAHSGGIFLLAETPLDRIPIFARAGAVIPMWPEAPASTDGFHPDVVELHLFVPTVAGTSRSFMQEDDGLTFAAAEGARYRTSFEVTRTGDRIRLRADVEGDGYPEFARQAFHVIVHGARPTSVELEDGPVRLRDGRFVLPNAGEGFTVEFDGD